MSLEPRKNKFVLVRIYHEDTLQSVQALITIYLIAT